MRKYGIKKVQADVYVGLNSGQLTLIKKLIETGLYGNSMSQCVVRLLDDRLKEVIRETNVS